MVSTLFLNITKGSLSELFLYGTNHPFHRGFGLPHWRQVGGNKVAETQLFLTNQDINSFLFEFMKDHHSRG